MRRADFGTKMGALTRPLRLVSYNVRYFGHALRGIASTRRPKRGIAEALARLDPLADVICLQEVETISMRSRIGFRSAHADESQLEAFMSALGESFAEIGKPCPYKAFYFRAHAYGPRRLPVYTTGLAILAHLGRLQITEHNQEKPHQITHRGMVLWENQKQTRICAHLKFSAGGRALHLFNTHLSLPTPFAKEFWSVREKMGYGQNQLKEAEALAGFVRQNAGDDPFFVCGDFNSAPGSPVYSFLTREAGFSAAQEALGLIDPRLPKAFPTAGVARLRMHLDHFFGGAAVDWMDMDGTCRYGDKASPFHGLSDHVPLIVRARV